MSGRPTYNGGQPKRVAVVSDRVKNCETNPLRLVKNY